jgi:hypothetical protein
MSCGDIYRQKSVPDPFRPMRMPRHSRRRCAVWRLAPDPRSRSKAAGNGWFANNETAPLSAGKRLSAGPLLRIHRGERPAHRVYKETSLLFVVARRIPSPSTPNRTAQTPTRLAQPMAGRRMRALRRTDDRAQDRPDLGAPQAQPLWHTLAPVRFQTGMGIEDVDRHEAEALGLIEPDEELMPAEADFTEGLTATTHGLSPRLRSAIGLIFGDQAKFDGDTIRWKNQPQPNPDDDYRYERARAGSRRLFARSLAAFERAGPADRRTADKETLQRMAHRAWSAEIAAAATGRKPLFHEQLGEERAAAAARALRQSLPQFAQMDCLPSVYKGACLFICRVRISAPPTARRVSASPLLQSPPARQITAG